MGCWSSGGAGKAWGRTCMQRGQAARRVAMSGQGNAEPLAYCPLEHRQLSAWPYSLAAPPPLLRSYKWDSLPNSQRPEKGLLRLRASLNAFANLRPAVVLPQLADASSLKREVGGRRGAPPHRCRRCACASHEPLAGSLSRRGLPRAPNAPSVSPSFACVWPAGGGGCGHLDCARAGGGYLLWRASGASQVAAGGSSAILHSRWQQCIAGVAARPARVSARPAGLLTAIVDRACPAVLACPCRTRCPG